MNRNDESGSWGVIVTSIAILLVSLALAWLIIPHGPTGLNLK